jgi:hypothetical protein
MSEFIAVLAIAVIGLLAITGITLGRTWGNNADAGSPHADECDGDFGGEDCGGDGD